MMPEMMGQMMKRREIGMMKGMTESMEQCPMMKMMGSAETGAKKSDRDEHSKHHPQ